LLRREEDFSSLFFRRKNSSFSGEKRIFPPCFFEEKIPSVPARMLLKREEDFSPGLKLPRISLE
ncbi:MAG: hypothetical protein ACI4D4_03055, partial [Lachnospira sp.]